MRLVTAVMCVLAVASVSAHAAQQDVVGQTVTITLSNGAKVTGVVTKREGGQVFLTADLIGDIVIAEKDVAAFGPGPAVTPPAAAPAQATAPSVKWTTNATVGYTFVSGAAPLLNVGDTHGVSLSGFTERASPRDAVALIGSFAYQRTKPSAASSNKGSLTLAYNRPLNPRFTLISRTTYSVDQVQEIDGRVYSVQGIAFVPVATRKVKLLLAPGVGFITTNRTDTGQLAPLFANVKNDAFGYGFYDSLTIAFVPTLTLTHSFQHLHSVRNSDQYLSILENSLVGMVTPRVGLSITFNANFDSQLPEPYFKQWTSSLVSGIQFKF